MGFIRYIAMPSRKSVPFTITSRPSGLPTAGCRLRPLLNTHEDAGFHDSGRPSSFSWPCLTPIERSFYAHTTSSFSHLRWFYHSANSTLTTCSRIRSQFKSQPRHFLAVWEMQSLLKKRNLSHCKMRIINSSCLTEGRGEPMKST